MRVQPSPELADEISGNLSSEYLIEKPLPHVAELIYCLTHSYFDRVSPLPPTDDELMLFCTGFGLERVLLTKHKRPKPQKFEGVGFSVDFDNFQGSPSELKTTRMSIKNAEAKGFSEGWIKQMMAYCKCRGVTDYYLAVLYIMGDYHPPFPQLKGYKLSFTEDEINANWNLLQMRKEIYLKHLRDGVPPEPFLYCMDWECDRCRYKTFKCDIISSIRSSNED